jgi:hypothetical protein
VRYNIWFSTGQKSRTFAIYLGNELNKEKDMKRLERINSFKCKYKTLLLCLYYSIIFLLLLKKKADGRQQLDKQYTNIFHL